MWRVAVYCIDKVVFRFRQDDNIVNLHGMSAKYRSLVDCIIFSVYDNKKSIIVIKQKWIDYYQSYCFTNKGQQM